MTLTLEQLDLWESGAEFCLQAQSDQDSDTTVLCKRNLKLIQMARDSIRYRKTLERIDRHLVHNHDTHFYTDTGGDCSICLGDDELGELIRSTLANERRRP